MADEPVAHPFCPASRIPRPFRSFYAAQRCGTVSLKQHPCKEERMPLVALTDALKKNAVDTLTLAYPRSRCFFSILHLQALDLCVGAGTFCAECTGTARLLAGCL